MRPKTRRFLGAFAQLTLVSALLFFVSIRIGRAAVDFVDGADNAQTHRSLAEWLSLGIRIPLAALAWNLLWLWFRSAEKQCVELIGER